MRPLKVMQGDPRDRPVRRACFDLFTSCGDAQATRRNDPTRIASSPESANFDANRNVDVFLDKIDVAIGEQHADVDTRMRRKKLCTGEGGSAASETDGGGDRDCSGEFLRLTCDTASSDASAFR